MFNNKGFREGQKTETKNKFLQATEDIFAGHLKNAIFLPKSQVIQEQHKK